MNNLHCSFARFLAKAFHCPHIVLYNKFLLNLYHVVCMGKVCGEKRDCSQLGDSHVTKNVQAMAAAALLRHAGLQTVLDALKQYRLACSTGSVVVAPKDTFNTQAASNWLFQQ